MDNHVISLSDELPTKEMVRKSFVWLCSLIILVRVVLRMIVVFMSDWHFDNLSGCHDQSWVDWDSDTVTMWYICYCLGFKTLILYGEFQRHFIVLLTAYPVL